MLTRHGTPEPLVGWFNTRTLGDEFVSQKKQVQYLTRERVDKLLYQFLHVAFTKTQLPSFSSSNIQNIVLFDFDVVFFRSED